MLNLYYGTMNYLIANWIATNEASLVPVLWPIWCDIPVASFLGLPEKASKSGNKANIPALMHAVLTLKLGYQLPYNYI